MKARFSIGERALVRAGNPDGHTRIPRYLRGKCGEVIALAGAFVLADDGARGIRSAPQMVYTVRFAAPDVWGADGHAADTIAADLWESYLDKLP